MNWKDMIKGQTADDWELYDRPNSDEAAKALNHILSGRLEIAIDRVKNGRMTAEEAAKWVRDEVEPSQVELSDFGAADTEPDHHKVLLINKVLGTDISRW